MSKKPQAKKASTPKEPKAAKVRPGQSSEALEWLRQNWRVAGLVLGFTFLVVFMKVHEEMSWSAGGEKADENFYELLGVNSQATAKDLKRQYNKLAMEFHPDKHPNCVDCEEKFRRISKAYDVLSNEESREHYDQTSGVLEPIRSQTTSLYLSNYNRLVRETPDVWLVQVFSETSSNAQTFSGFWEEFAQEHDYINFGRINYHSQGKLVSQLPFAVDELPHVFSLAPGRHSEVLEYSYDRSPNAELRNFLKTAIGVHYTTVSPADLPNLRRQRTAKSRLVLAGVDSVPISFMYYALRYAPYFDFLATPMGTHRQFSQQLGKDRASAVFLPGRSLKAAMPERIFEGGQDKRAMKSILAYSMFTVVPGSLIRTRPF